MCGPREVFLCSTGNMDEGDAPIMAMDDLSTGARRARPPLVVVKVVRTCDLEAHELVRLRREVTVCVTKRGSGRNSCILGGFLIVVSKSSRNHREWG
jgi:hypothetical protein